MLTTWSVVGRDVALDLGIAVRGGRARVALITRPVRQDVAEDAVQSAASVFPFARCVLGLVGLRRCFVGGGAWRVVGLGHVHDYDKCASAPLNQEVLNES